MANPVFLSRRPTPRVQGNNIHYEPKQSLVNPWAVPSNSAIVSVAANDSWTGMDGGVQLPHGAFQQPGPVRLVHTLCRLRRIKVLSGVGSSRKTYQ